MPEKTNPDEWEELVMLKGIPAAGELSQKDRLQNDDCNGIAEIILHGKNSYKKIVATIFEQNAELHTINQALSNELALYRSILLKNIPTTPYDIDSYIHSDFFSLAMPPLEKFSPKVFNVQLPPEIDPVRVTFPEPEKPIPKYAEREPQLSDAKYSRAGIVAGVFFIASLVFPLAYQIICTIDGTASSNTVFDLVVYICA